MRKKGRRGNMRPATDLGDRLAKTARGNVPELPFTTIMVAISRVPNGNNNQTSSDQLQSWYRDVWHWEGLNDFVEKEICLKEPYWPTAIYKCNLMQKELDKEYRGLCAPGQMMNNLLYGQISYNGSLSNAFKLQLGQNV